MIIERFAYSPFGTFGRMEVGGISLYTIEALWLNNKKNISCIPIGEYMVGESYYYRGQYRTFEVLNVPDRSHILFHVANRLKDIRGCIGLGFSLGCIDEDWAITSSRDAHEFFMEHLVANSIKEFSLEIREYEGN